jgi:hypothetical protein
MYIVRIKIDSLQYSIVTLFFRETCDTSNIIYYNYLKVYENQRQIMYEI